MKSSQKGFVGIALVIIVVIALGAGGTYYVTTKEKTNAEIVAPKSSPATEDQKANPNAKEGTSLTIKAPSIGVVTPTVAREATSVAVKSVPEKVDITTSIDTKFDAVLKSWIIAWKQKDVNVLKDRFGYSDIQIRNMGSIAILNYNSYMLYKSKSTSPTSDDIAMYKEYGGEVPFDIKVTGYYIVSKSTGVYHVAIINGNYKNNSNAASITQWQIYPSEDNVKTYTSVQEAKIQIDKLAGY